MIKRIMSITVDVALVLMQSAAASAAFVSDGTAGPYTAKVTISGTPTASLSVAIKKVADNTASADVNWSGVNIGDTWEISTEYLEVTYAANQVGWGVQVYTDNKNNTLNPYPGDPTVDPSQQPVGLIGVDNSAITCPMVVLVTNDTIPATSIITPAKDSSGTPGDPDYVEWFITGYDEIAGGDYEKVWFWLKDQQGTVWDDKNTNGVIDLTGSFGDPDYELVADFVDPDDYATIVNTLGSSSGRVSAGSGDMLRDNAAATPIIVYMAADFTNATELQEYKTETLELEIYHES